MNVIDLIEKKKQGKTHSKEEINFIVKSLMNGTALDSQISAWLMAVCFKGLTEEETANLTEALASSGKVVDFGELSNLVVDKHSTGGVGDKVTITLIPLLAAAGIPVAKLADRGLGIAAGTVDKLESIPHLNTNLSTETIVNQVKNINAVIASQADDLAPADKKLYSLRNLTGTADSEVLIASSIISKKIPADFPMQIRKAAWNLLYGKAMCKFLRYARFPQTHRDQPERPMNTRFRLKRGKELLLPHK